MKKKLNKKDFIFEKLQGQTLFKKPGQINGIDFLISNLNDCTVYLCDHIAQIFVDDCKNCKVYLGPVNGSCFVRDCENIEISAAAEQFRISDSKNITALIYSATDPALEKSTQIVIGPYNFAYQKAAEHFQAAKIDVSDISKNHWSQVYDFTPGKSTKNWEIITPDKFPGNITYSFDDIEGEAENPVPRHIMYGGQLQEQFIVGSVEGKETAEGGMFSFDIQTGMQQAQEIVNKVEEQQQNLDDYFNAQGQNIDNNIPMGQPLNDDDMFQQYDLNDQQGGEIRDDLFIQGQTMNIQQMSPRKQKLIDLEANINEQLKQKEQEELYKRNEIISNALKELNEWRQQRQQQLEARKKRNRENQQLFIEQQANNKIENNPWSVVADNINLKSNESQEGKDVSRIKQAILGAKADFSKRLQQQQQK